MGNKRYQGDYDEPSFSYLVGQLVGEFWDDRFNRHPVDLAHTLDRHANAIRSEADDPPTRYTIENPEADRFDFAVYDETGEQYLFEDKETLLGFIEEKLDEVKDD